MSPAATNGVHHENGEIEDLEVLVVGMGFGGIYLLYNLRKKGYKVRAVEAGGGLGGIWWWNSYPGARVDTSLPFYELSDEALWKDWTWKERFPAQEELQQYFQHVDKVWNLSKDVQYNTTVTGARFDQEQNKWTVQTDVGTTFKCRYLVLATGFAAKEVIPDIKGLETFKGPAFHTAKMPKGKGAIDFQGRRVAVIGTGASGVQVIQELGPIVQQLTVFQRTPNLALPMRQRKLNEEGEQARGKRDYKYLFELRKRTTAGWDYSYNPKKTFEVTPEERNALWEELWEKGGFNPWLGNFSDLMSNREASDLMYAFWRDKVRQRITRPELIDDLCPDTAPSGSPFGTKRPSLEQRFYEVIQQPNVELVNLNKRPILEVTPTGIVIAEGNNATKECSLDIIVLATGFDAGSGSLTKIDIHGTTGQSLKEKWTKGTRTHLGIATAGFPNLLFLYGPQSPGAFAIGPASAEIQGDWIISCLEDLKKLGKTRIEALTVAEERWAKLTNDLMNMTLIPTSSSWYIGANVPGKVREATNYIGGLPAYTKAIYDCSDNGYEGFVLN
ncbi:cyclohexanone monooxygenase [Lepidopterella palustris CBS 459.81]|uniref:Cyclohexanone monooxygenase n=1 Tax=Lepidopterella palustris CBS 459.81 TaxID=1314670 RepID=A0A8E2E509_9PEZI|nr:cyclohexanone monooxygenase [Lepidopterella palustris CBS 459.81]